MTIKPTVGRVVWYWPSKEDMETMVVGFGTNVDHQPCRADIVFVYDDRTVNLAVNDHAGIAWQRQQVKVALEGEVYPSDEARWCWMPYQIGQAKAARSERFEPDEPLVPVLKIFGRNDT